jgi:hypothetical protein
MIRRNRTFLRGGLNTKQAKDFLVGQTVEQAVLDGVSLADVEKRMMYFTESDPASCNNPIELNDEFEAEHETKEYETKISRLLHHAYSRLKEENPERARNWDQAIRTLRKGDHYLLVLWDQTRPSEHPARDSFKLLGVGLLVAAVIILGAFLAANYNIDLDRYRRFLPIAVIVLVLLAGGGFRAVYRLLFASFHRKSKENEPQS